MYQAARTERTNPHNINDIVQILFCPNTIVSQPSQEKHVSDLLKNKTSSLFLSFCF